MRKFATTVAACGFLLFSLAAEVESNDDTSPGFDEKTFKGLEWRGIGPALMSGRIADIAFNQPTVARGMSL